jgi:hypothetical protein
MNKHILAALAVAGVLMGPGADLARAQEGDDRAGTAAMEELLVPVTPRTVALGNAFTSGIANANSVEAVLSNPAALVLGQGTSAMFSRTNYWADIGVNYFGIAQRFGVNSVGITLTAWDYGDIFRQTEEAPEIDSSATWDASTFVVGATFARQFTDRIAAGVTLKGLGRQIDNVNSSGVAFDAGMTYVVGESGLRFGVSLKNFGTGMSFSGDGLQRPISQQGPDGDGEIGGEVDDLESELPSSLNFGAAYTTPLSGDLSLTALANFRSNAYDLDNYAAGVEFGYQELFFVRGGVDVRGSQDVNAWEMWNVGAGLNLDLSGTRIAVDYAYRPSNVFGGVNMFSVGLGL